MSAVRAQGALVEEPGGPFVLRELLIDEPGPAEVLVEVRAVGLCASDRHATRDGTSWPAIAGHELSGRVVRCGSGVGDLAPGDHVVGCLVRFCGACPPCLRGTPRLCLDPDATLRHEGDPPRVRTAEGEPVTQLWGLGGFATHVLVHRAQLIPVPDGLPHRLSCLLGCAALTGVGTVLHAAGLELGSSVAVFGVGGVGLSCIQGAALTAATRIIAVDVHPARLRAARAMGATHTVDARHDDAADAIRRITGHGVDVAIDAAGTLSTTSSAHRSTRNGGRTLLVGLHAPDARLEISPLVELTLGQKAMAGVSMGSGDPRTDIPALAELALQGRLDLQALATDLIPLADVDEGYRNAAAGGGIRTVAMIP